MPCVPWDRWASFPLWGPRSWRTSRRSPTRSTCCPGWSAASSLRSSGLCRWICTPYDAGPITIYIHHFIIFSLSLLVLLAVLASCTFICESTEPDAMKLAYVWYSRHETPDLCPFKLHITLLSFLVSIFSSFCSNWFFQNRLFYFNFLMLDNRVWKMIAMFSIITFVNFQIPDFYCTCRRTGYDFVLVWRKWNAIDWRCVSC